MKILSTWIIICIIATFSYAGEEVNLFQRKLSFKLPDEITTMSKEDAKQKYLIEVTRPKYIYSNRLGTTSIAVDTDKNLKLQPEQLAAYKSFMETTFERMIPGIKWIKRDFTSINNIKWIRLEFISNAIDAKIHNIILITSFEGSPLIFNFNSTKEEFPTVKKELYKSIYSINIK